MRSKQYFTSIKNNPHEISTDPFYIESFLSEKKKALLLFFKQQGLNIIQGLNYFLLDAGL